MDLNIWDIKKAEKVCALDIDGVLNDYPKCWIDFVNIKTATEFADLNDIKNTLTYDTYRKLKEDYRLSGIKERLKPNENASLLTQELKKLGYTIIIITARPANKYPALYSQTLNWLKNNNICYDSIYFGQQDKHAKILSEAPNIKFMIEDNSYIANMVSRWGYKVFLLTNQYNYNLTLEKNVVRIDNLIEVLKYVK